MVIHNIPPVYNSDSEILILGSFPSVKSRESGFAYGHPQNRFWRVLAAILTHPVPQTIEDKKSLLLANNIAMWDVVGSCEIKGSSDSSITNVTPNDIAGLVTKTKVGRIYTNGGTAHKLYKKYCLDSVGIADICLPSTSPANAAKNLDSLIDSWRVIIHA